MTRQESNGGKKFKHRWGRTQPLQTMQWSHELLGSIEIGVINFKVSPNTAQVGPNNWTRIYPQDKRPKVVQVRFTGSLKDGVTLLYAQGTQVTNMMSRDKFPAFDVPVTWNPREDDDDLPHTRMKDKDNIDLILITGDLAFQLQVSVITRKEQFWLCAQETHGGRVIEYTAEEAKELGLTTCEVNGKHYIMEPLFAENAYPGADYLGNFKDVGCQIIEHIVKSGTPIATFYEPEKWTDVGLTAMLPPDLNPKNNWRKGTVTWYNVVLGWGFARDEHGKSVFLHFSTILNEHMRPVVQDNHPGILQPMSAVAFKAKEEKGGLKATAVRIIE